MAKLTDKLSAILATPVAQKTIAGATSEPAKIKAIRALYRLLPFPMRWMIGKAAFARYVRQYIFQENT